MALSKDSEETDEGSEALANEELRGMSVREGLVADRMKEYGNRNDGSTRGSSSNANSCISWHPAKPPPRLTVGNLLLHHQPQWEILELSAQLQ